MRALSAILFFAASASSSTSAGEVRSSPWNVPFGFSGSCTAASTIAIPDLPSNGIVKLTLSERTYRVELTSFALIGRHRLPPARR